MATLRSGRAFGEMAVLDGERRSASCVAASNCQLLNLGKDSLEKMLNDAPKIAAKIIRALAVSLSKRLRMADGQLAVAAGLTAGRFGLACRFGSMPGTG